MDKTYKGLLMIIAISLVFINIQLFFQSFVLPSHASSGVMKVQICNGWNVEKYGTDNCAKVRRGGHLKVDE